MNDLVDLWDRPSSSKYMIAGWYQWADAGEISSGLPHYLIEQTDARHIGEMNPSGYYLFQFPGTHDLLRPMVTLEEGYRVEMEERRNAFYAADEEENGFLILPDTSYE